MIRTMISCLAIAAAVALVASEPAMSQGSGKLRSDGELVQSPASANSAGNRQYKPLMLRKQPGAGASSGGFAGKPGSSKHIEGTDVSTGGTCSDCGDE